MSGGCAARLLIGAIALAVLIGIMAYVVISLSSALS